MLKLLAFGIGAGIGFQSLRNYPPDGPLSSNGLIVAVLVAIVCAYLGGRARRGATSVAVASATAEAHAASVASNSVNVYVSAPGGGAVPVGMVIPDESLPWMGGQRPMLSADQLDGMEASELVEVLDGETA